MFLFFAAAVATAAVGVRLVRRFRERAVLTDARDRLGPGKPRREHIVGSLDLRHRLGAHRRLPRSRRHPGRPGHRLGRGHARRDRRAASGCSCAAPRRRSRREPPDGRDPRRRRQRDAARRRQLLRHLHPRGLRVVMVERCRDEVGRGLAYSTPYDLPSPQRARREDVGALPRDGGPLPALGAPRGTGRRARRLRRPRPLRRLPARWLLDEAVARARPGVELVRVARRGQSPTSTRRRHAAPARRRAAARRPPRPRHRQPAARRLRRRATPTCCAAAATTATRGTQALPATAARDRDVLLIGTGLTMVDVALDAGRRVRRRSHPRRLAHRAAPARARPTHPTSRRHCPTSCPTATFEPRRARRRRRAPHGRRRRRSGGNWRDVIDSLRPVTNRIWDRLPADRARALRPRGLPPLGGPPPPHGARPWPTPSRRLRANGRLEVRGSGLIRALRAGRPGGIEARLRTGTSFTVDRVVNCTGPVARRCALAEDPLLAVAGSTAGHVRPGPLGLGLDHDSRGALVGADGDAVAAVLRHRAGPQGPAVGDHRDPRDPRAGASSSPTGSRPSCRVGGLRRHRLRRARPASRRRRPA